MNRQERIKELIGKYNAMLADPAEIREVEQLLESGVIQLEDLYELNSVHNKLVEMQSPEPTLALDDKFFTMLRKEKAEMRGFDWQAFFSWRVLVPRLAFASVLLIVGFFAGRLMIATPVNNDEMRQVRAEVSTLKELMMLALLEKESATDRLKAVSLTQEMDQASKKVTMALIQTLNHDDNVNVRLAALDALRPYSNESAVREALIHSIGEQDSPLVQIALAELMAELQAKGSVSELEKIVRSNRTPADVKKKIQESIKVLI